MPEESKSEGKKTVKIIEEVNDEIASQSSKRKKKKTAKRSNKKKKALP